MLKTSTGDKGFLELGLKISGMNKAENILGSLKDINKTDDLAKALVFGGIKDKDILKEIAGNANYVDSVDDLTDAMDAFADSQKGIKAVGTAFKNLGSKIKGVGSSIISTLGMFSPFELAIMGVGAALTAAIIISDKFIVTYDEAQEKAEESASAYNETKSTLESLSSEYETLQNKIEELDALENPTLANQEELETLKQESLELERQIALKERLLELEQAEAEKNAIDALKKNDVFLGSTYDENGNQYEKGSKAYDANIVVGTDAESLNENLNKVKEYEEAIEDLENKQKDKNINKMQYDDYQEEIDRYKQNIIDLESDMSIRADKISSHLEIISDKTSDVYKENAEALDNYLNRDLSPLDKIENFFDGSSYKNRIKTELIEIAKSEDGLDNVASAFHRLGINFDETGIDAQRLTEYINELAEATEEASKAADSYTVDGSYDGVLSALETENADTKWEEISNAYSTVDELIKNKKWGTDDVQSFIQFISPEEIKVKEGELTAAKYQEAWNEYKDKAKRYFDSEDPLQAAINAQNALIDAELGTRADGTIDWSGLTSSADAADAWGVSLEAAEVIMKNLESHGAEKSHL